MQECTQSALTASRERDEETSLELIEFSRYFIFRIIVTKHILSYHRTILGSGPHKYTKLQRIAKPRRTRKSNQNQSSVLYVPSLASKSQKKSPNGLCTSDGSCTSASRAICDRRSNICVAVEKSTQERVVTVAQAELLNKLENNARRIPEILLLAGDDHPLATLAGDPSLYVTANANYREIENPMMKTEFECGLERKNTWKV